MRKQALFLLGGLLALSAPAYAQRSTASLRGTVSDPTSAVIAGAKVTVKGEDTGLTRSTTTNSAGLYSFTDLPVGSYRIEVEFAGFRTAVRSHVGLNVADTRALDLQLETGEVTEQVTVEAAAVAVQTVGGDVSGLVTGEQVRELPLNGRNFLQLATLMPGVAAPDFLNVKDKGLLGGSDLSVSGSDVTSNIWTVDGANNNDVGSNRTILVYPSVDSIEEFKIHRNSYGAEFGQSGGAQINIVTRSGANEFHGSAYYFGRRDALNSKNYFLEIAGQDKEKLDYNAFGWTFGGPIIKDKLHFFASQEFNRETRGSVRTAFVPTEAERNGDFSGSRIDGCSPPIPIDPLTGQPFPGNRIPSNRLSPGGLLYLQLYPTPNTTPGAGSCNNWVTSLNSPINWREESLRLDWTLTNTTRVMVRYTQDAWTNNAPNLNSNLWGDDPFPAVDSNWDQPGKSLVAQLTHNVGSKGVNSLQFSYSANSITVTRGGTNPDLNNQINAAIPGLFPDSIREYGADRGHPVFWGGAGYSTLWNEAPFRNNQDLFVLRDDYSAVFGKHFLKAGILGSFNKKNEDSQGNGSLEASQFWGSTGLASNGVGTGNLLADFLLRDMTFGFTEIGSQRQVPQRWKDLELYAQDSWKVRPHVTVDYGIRYSRFYNPYAADDGIASFNPARFDPALGADPCNGLMYPPGTNPCQAAGFLGGSDGPNRSLYDQNTNLFAPRLGIAWDVHGDGKMAIRAGAGQFFLRERLSPGLGLANNPPFNRLLTGQRTLDSAQEPCPGCFGVANGAPAVGREVKALTPNNWQWNVSVQREIFRNTTLELAYVGSKGNHLLRTYDANQVQNGDINGNGVDDRLDYVRAGDDSGARATVRPYGAIGDGRITFWDHSGDSIYHSLQTQLLSRFGRGSQLQASYTWSRAISNIPLDNSDGGLSAEMSALDLGNPAADRGLARVHRAHVFNASLVLELPTLENKSGFVKHVFGDWEIGTIAAAASGTPITVHTGSIPGLNGGPSGTGYTDNQRANRVPGVSCRASGGAPEQILNPAAYTLNGFQLGSIGDAGRGDCIGPSFFQVDLALYKNIRLGEKVKLQLRFEVFNVFNRVNFITNGSSSGGVNNSMDPSEVTLDAPLAQATQITSATIPASFGQATSARDPRQAQFGVKLIF
jgi:Carboxypeptidase regulatory-like domain